MSQIKRNIRFNNASSGPPSPGSPVILVVDDDVRIQSLVCGALASVAGDFPLLRAASVKEALQLAGRYPVRVFILDVELPDGTGLDFYRQVRDDHRGADTIVITGTPLIVDENFSERFGTPYVLRKPFDITVLRDLVKEFLSRPPEPDAKPEFESFAGTLTSLTPTDLIQLKSIGKSTCALRFTAEGEREGTIYFKLGEIVHAESGIEAGVNAFNSIVSWKGGSVEDLPFHAVERTINNHWESLLMEALRLVDEAEAAR